MTLAHQERAESPTEVPARSSRRWFLSPRRALALMFLLVQLAWVVIVPPFGGMDEYDHAYRAVSVARGAWGTDPSAATRGTGALLDVPDDIVAAAKPECEGLPYTGPQDCIGTPNGDGTTRIASGAGRYHPLYYALVGWPALPFHGYAALYVMRIVTVLMTWLLFCGALAAVRTWARTPWPTIGLAVAATPVAMYSTTVVSPNGVEIFAAMLCWTALIGLFRSTRPRVEAGLLTGVAVGGSVLATTRGLGPLWLLLVLLTTLVAAPPSRDRMQTLLRAPRAWVAAAVVGVAAAQSTWWILSTGSLDVGGQTEHARGLGERIGSVSGDSFLWVLQSVAAFPFRNDRSPTLVYACYLLVFVGMLVLGLRASSGALRRGLVLCAVASLAVPFAITVATYNSHEGVWQGRYGLPYAIGIPILCALALERSPAPRRLLAPRTQILAGGLYVAACTVGAVSAMNLSVRYNPLRHDSAWVHPPVAVVAVLVALASGALWWSANHTQQTEGER